MNWADLQLPAGWKQTAAGEYHGPCPFQSGSSDTFWVNPDEQLLGCRQCSPDGDGGLGTGELLKQHAEALGIWEASKREGGGVDVDVGLEVQAARCLDVDHGGRSHGEAVPVGVRVRPAGGLHAMQGEGHSQDHSQGSEMGAAPVPTAGSGVAGRRADLSGGGRELRWRTERGRPC